MKKETLQTLANLSLIGSVVSRTSLMSQLGQQYSGNRDIYKALGYSKYLVYQDYYDRYERQDIAKAIIDRPVNSTWRGGVLASETDNEIEETTFEKGWKKVFEDLGLQSKFVRLDKLVGLGEYAVLFLGLSDASNERDLINPVNSSNLELIYVKPFSDTQAYISEWERSPNNPRYGLPVMYDLTVVNPGTNEQKTVKVHYSRLIHVADGLMDNEVYGTPRLKVVFNRLMDLEKIVGGSAEMFWRGARPGYKGKVHPDFQMTDDLEDEIMDQMEQYERDLRRFLISEGVDIEALESQVADPKDHVAVQIEMISAVTGIPSTILTGSERGELASIEDRTNWLDFVNTRREEFVVPHILRPFTQAGIEYGFIPKPSQDFSFVWKDLYSPSEKEKAEIGRSRAMALANYTKNLVAQEIIPPPVFIRHFLGFDPDRVKNIENIIEEYDNEELEDLRKIMKDPVSEPNDVDEKDVDEEE
jgi:hypothetical protein